MWCLTFFLNRFGAGISWLGGWHEGAGVGPIPADTLRALSFCMENGNILESRFKTLTYILHVKSLKDWVQHCKYLSGFVSGAAASQPALTGCHDLSLNSGCWAKCKTLWQTDVKPASHISGGCGALTSLPVGLRGAPAYAGAHPRGALLREASRGLGTRQGSPAGRRRCAAGKDCGEGPAPALPPPLLPRPARLSPAHAYGGPRRP